MEPIQLAGIFQRDIILWAVRWYRANTASASCRRALAERGAEMSIAPRFTAVSVLRLEMENDALVLLA